MNNNHAYYIYEPIDPVYTKKTTITLAIITIIVFILLYISEIRYKYLDLKNIINKTYNTCDFFNKCTLENAISDLLETPKFFFSPLWIARFLLKKSIHIKIHELRQQLLEFENK